MKSGIVVYRRSGTSLCGRWAHEDFGGMLANEIVHGVPPDAWEGDWPVEIFAPDGQPMFSGRLSSVKLGDCKKLTWQGNFAQGNKAGTFEGIGQVLDGQTMSASFEQTA